mgnify:FL=1
MSNLIPLVDLSSNLWRKVRDNWINRVHEKKNISGTSDWLAERPENWYQGPLIFPAFPEEGVEKETAQSHRAEAVGFNEEWSD